MGQCLYISWIVFEYCRDIRKKLQIIISNGFIVKKSLFLEKIDYNNFKMINKFFILFIFDYLLLRYTLL